MIFRPLMRLLLSWTPLTRIATRTRRWSCNFCVTIWLFGHLMLQPTTQTLEMPLQPLSKKNNNKKKKLVKSRQASAIGLAFPCSILQFFLLLQNLKAEPRCPPPTCSLFFVDTPKTSSYVFIKKTQILGNTSWTIKFLLSPPPPTLPWSHNLHNYNHLHHKLHHTLKTCLEPFISYYNCLP